MDITKRIKEELIKIFDKLSVHLEEDILLQPSDSREHGDYYTNVCLKNAKAVKMKPIDLANQIASSFSLEGIKDVQAVFPGFLNFFLKEEQLGEVINQILSQNENYPSITEGKGIKVNIEYVSANPTGTLHLGHARGAAIGDSLARIYKKAGYDVTREYYINDAGKQIDHLADSLIARYLQLCGKECEVPEDGYHGEEIISVAKELYKKVEDSYKDEIDEHYEEIKQFAQDQLLEKIKEDLHNFRVDQDVYTSEKEIRNRGDVEKVLSSLMPNCYKKDDAIFLNTTKDGDDKDRVLVKSDGTYTYLLPDIAYHQDKINRGFNKIIDLFGADHHGYITRLKSSLSSLGNDPDILTVKLVQMVRLFKNGEEFKMSKRTGNAVSMKELVSECSVDAIRYFFVSRACSSHLDFNLDLAMTLKSENPVFYAQYTHARLCGIMSNGKRFFPLSDRRDLLLNEKEKNVLIILRDYKDVILTAVEENEPFKITNYVHQLSVALNEFYTVCKVLDDKDVELSKQRLALVKASSIVLKDALSLIGVDAPERMISSDNEDKR